MMKKNHLSIMLYIASAVLVILSFVFTGSLATETMAVENNVTAEPMDVENIEFDFDKATLRDESEEELDLLVAILKEKPAAIKLSGHADSIGAYVYNWNLSKSRADMVKVYLISKGIDEAKIAATEYGNTKPIASNATEEGRQRNRRVEIALVQ